MQFPDYAKSLLLNDISSMAHNPELFVKSPGRDFTRNRKISMQALMEFYICMESGNLQHDLLKYFDFHPDTASVSAFHQQRSKLKPEAFLFLLKQFNSHFPMETYKNSYQLIACDGSEFNISLNETDTDSYYPPSGKSKRGFNMLHVIPLYDLLSKCYLDVELQPIRKKNEFRAFCNLIDRFECKDERKPIFIADRGFCSYNVFAHAFENHAYFLIRAKDIYVSRLLKEDISDRELDVSIQRIFSRTLSKKKWLHPEWARLYKHVCANIDFDYISEENPEYAMRLRVVRFRISENTYENIITNLPENEFPSEEIKMLYNLRWNIELSFRDLKQTIATEQFHCKNREYIGMEIYARMILYNFCSFITARIIIEKKDTKHVYQVNYSMAIKICHKFLSAGKGFSWPAESLIGRFVLPIRPGRQYTRRKRLQPPARFAYRFI